MLTIKKNHESQVLIDKSVSGTASDLFGYDPDLFGSDPDLFGSDPDLFDLFNL